MKYTQSSLWGLLLALLILVPVVFVSAETPARIVANMNLTNAEIVLKDTQRLVVNFKLSNKGTVTESDIRYGIELIRNVGADRQVVADTYVAPHTLSVPQGEQQQRTLEYPTRGVAPGTYSVWIIAKTAGGMTLGQAFAGEVIIKAPQSVVEIVPESCEFRITGEAKPYSIGQGVDLSPEEVLTLNCTLKNHGTEVSTVIPEFETYRRGVYFRESAFMKKAEAQLTLAPLESKTISYPIALPPDAQAYDTTLVLKGAQNRETIVSNKLVMHYVVQGLSATIQNIALDKSFYREGEAMNVNLAWIDSADGFLGSRKGTGTQGEGEVVASVRIVDAEGNLCAPVFERTVAASRDALTLTATSDCSSPTVSLSIRSAGGEELDTRTVTTPLTEEDARRAKLSAILDSGMESVGVNTIPNGILASVLAFSLAFLAGVYFYRRLGRVVSDSVVLKSLLTLFFVGASFIFGTSEAYAVTWSHAGTVEHYGSMTLFEFSVNTDRDVYAPGEDIVLNTVATNPQCSNTAWSYDLWADFNGDRVELDRGVLVTGGNFRYYSTTLQAPSTPGTYTIELTSEVNDAVVNDAGIGLESGPQTTSIEIIVEEDTTGGWTGGPGDGTGGGPGDGTPTGDGSLSVPENLTFVPGSCGEGSVLLYWSTSYGAESYELISDRDGVVYTGSDTWFWDTGLPLDTEVGYRVQAVNSGGSSGFTPSIYGFTPSECAGDVLGGIPMVSPGGDRVITLPTNFVDVNDATASDPDGDPLTLSWTSTDTPGGAGTPTITNGTSLTPSFSGLNTPGVYEFTLTAQDTNGGEASAAMTVTVLAAGAPGDPTAYAGGNVSITLPDTNHTVSGASASDPDGDPLTLSWTSTDTPGGAGTPTITNGTSLTPSFSGLNTPGVYEFTLTAQDTNGGEATSVMTVTVVPAVITAVNNPPSAYAGGNVSITLPDTNHTVSGASASDPDGDPLTLSWSNVQRPAGAPAVSISGGSSLSPTLSGMTYPGSYNFVLRATDDSGASDDSLMTVTVIANPPTISANPRLVAGGNPSTVVTWDTNGYPIDLCTLSGGSLTNADLTASGGSGSQAVTVVGRTVFTLDCGPSEATAQSVVEVTPSQVES
jgi:hypothetical protein